jgi:hypothetical protein
MVDDLPVLSVYAVWHPGCSRAATFGRTMFAALCADPDIPASRGLGIQVRFRTSNLGEEIPAPIPFDRAQHTAVLVLADDLLVADPTWRAYADSLMASARPADLVVPVAITSVGNLPPYLRQLQAIRLDQVPEAQQSTILLNDVMHDLCRLLDPRASKVKVFLSHAKEDGLSITTSVRRHLHEVARLDEFFDAADIPDGTRFGEFVASSAGSLPVLLAVQTDAYASRDWCRLEVLEAKRHHVPIVVLSALKSREVRSFPYIGNTPVVRWSDESSLPHIVRALLGEVLRDRFFPKKVQPLCNRHGLNSAMQVFSYPPELVTLLTYRAEMTAAGATMGKYLYPDPPLGTEELHLLKQFDPEIYPVTPTTLQAL